MTLTATHLGLNQVDLLPRFMGPQAQSFPSADGTLRVVRLAVSGTLPVGTYVVDVNAATALGTDFDSVSVVVY